MSCGAIQSTKMSGNLGLKLNGPVRFNQKSFQNTRSTFRGGPLFSVEPVRSKWTVPIPFDHSDPFSIAVPVCSVFSMYNTAENTYHCSFYGLLTPDLSVLLVHPCAVQQVCSCSASQVYVLAVKGS